MTGKDVNVSGCTGGYDAVMPSSVDRSGWSEDQTITIKDFTVRQVEYLSPSGEVVYLLPIRVPDMEFRRRPVEIRYIDDETFKRVHAEMIEEHADLFQAIADSDLD